MERKEIVEGVAVGILAALVLLYGLQPHQPYPKWMLLPYEQPWIFVFVGIAVIYVFLWSRTVGVLLILMMVALYADMLVFGRPVKPSGGQISVGPPFKTTLPSEKIMKPLFATQVPEGQFVDGRPTDDAVREGPTLHSVPLDVKNYSLFTQITEANLQPGDGAPF